jgi:hypothetical protein
MKQAGLRILAAALVSLAALPTLAGDLPPEEQYKLRGEYLWWRPNLESQVQATRGSVTGSLIDLQDDLGIQDERTFQVRGSLQFAPGHKLRFSYTPLDYAADLDVGRTFSFLGQTYTLSTQVQSSLKGKLYFGAYEFDLVKTPQGYLGVMLGAQYFDGGVAIAAPEIGVRESLEPTVPVPVVGVTGRGYVGKLSFEGELNGLTIGERGHAYEFSVGARFHVSQKLAGTAGYRRVNIEGHDNEDLLKFKMGGFTFGLELSL